MAEKKEQLSIEQIYLLASNGYSPAEWDVLYDLKHSMIIRRKDLTDAAIIFK